MAPVMGRRINHQNAFRYRGFLLLEQPHQRWLVRPERSPMRLLPFRTTSCSLTEVKTMLDKRLDQDEFFKNIA